MSDQKWTQTSFCQCDCMLVPPAARHAHQKLIKNVSIFNGESEDLITGHDLVLEGHKIVGLIPAGGSEDGYDAVIDGKGGFLTPGLVDIHWHTMLGLDPASLMVCSGGVVVLDFIVLSTVKLTILARIYSTYLFKPSRLGPRVTWLPSLARNPRDS